MKPPEPETPEKIKQERDALLTIARNADEDRKVLRLLVAGGFITEEKIEEARALLRPLR